MKLITKIVGATLGLAMAIGVGVGVANNNNRVAKEANALVGDIVETFDSDVVVTDSTYAEYTNDYWKLSKGGNNKSAGWNKSNWGTVPTGYQKYLDGVEVTSSHYAWVAASKNTLSNVGSFDFYHNSTTTNNKIADGKLYLTYSTNGTSYSLVTLTSGTQGTATANKTTITYSFDTIESAYYAIVVTHGTSGRPSSNDIFRFDSVVANFYEGATAPAEDYIGSLSVSPNSWTGCDTQTISLSSFTVSGSKNGVNNAVTSSDYVFQGIGTLNGNTFTARTGSNTLDSFQPLLTENCLRWKAKYPTTLGGSTYAVADVTLNVSEDTVSSIALSNNMSTVTYEELGTWKATGLTVSATYLSSTVVDVTAGATFNFYSDSSMTNEIAAPSDLGVGENQEIFVKATYSGVSNETGYSQTVTVTSVPRFRKANSLENGKKYIIAANGGTEAGDKYYLPAATATVEKNPAAVKVTSFVALTKAKAWDVSVDASSHIVISNTVGANKYYLVATDTAQGIAVSDTSTGYWTFDGTNLSFSVGSTRVLVCYNDSSFRYYAIASNTSPVANIFYEYIPTAKETIETVSTKSSLSYSYSVENAVYSYSNVTIRFGGSVTKAMWDALNSESPIQGYGVMISTADSSSSGYLGEHNFKDEYATAIELTEGNVDEAIDLVCSNDKILNFAKLGNPYLHEAANEANYSEDTYAWNLVQKINSDHLTRTYVAVAYIRTNAGLVFLQEERISAQGIADRMVKSGEYDGDPLYDSLSYLADL